MPFVEISERWRILPRRSGGLDFLSLPGPQACALLQGEGEWTIFAEDPLLVADGLEPAPLRILRAGDLPPIFPDFIGFASYEAGFTLDPCLPVPEPFPWPFPLVHFALHRKVLLHQRSTGLLWEGTREGLPSLGLEHPWEAGTFRARKLWDSADAASHAELVERVRGEIRKGNVYQANLARQEAWAFRGDLRELASRLRAANPAPYSALISGPGFAVLSSSPESFLRIQDGRIETRPIKGTCRRGADPAEDRRLAFALGASPKDQAELAMIVDLVRNDLARVCELPSVEVEAGAELLTLANVHHLVARVSGRIRQGATLAEIFRALFPAGSITGCPKLAAITLLRRLEPHPRLAYTGALGWFRHDLGQLELAVAIRTLSVGPGELRLGLGGGIVWDSDPEAEYLETIHKGRSLVQCLSC
jgi:para-aminobenzoate synthetase component 1